MSWSKSNMTKAIQKKNAFSRPLKDSLREYPVHRRLFQICEVDKVQYILLWYSYTLIDNTIEQLEHIPSHVIIDYRRAL